MVSPCYHKMCESCIDRLFSLGPAACPECGQIVRKQQFSAQTFQDLRVEEEVDVRKRVSKLFNRKPNEFPSLKAYNDYLEEFEEITFNLVNKVDVEHTQARLAQYEALNKAQIAAHLQFREQESQRQHQADEAAKQERQMRTKRVMEEQEREQAARDADEKEMMAMLTNGTSIEEVVKERQRRIDKRAKEAALREEKEQTRMQQYEEALQKRVAPRTTYTPLETEYIRKVLASDFCGPFATLRDGSDLCTVRNTPAKLGGLGGDGYVDPWLRPELVDASAVMAARLEYIV
ncbi:Tfb3p [Malassezia vespertilionis]|uniref:RNA polymerase II transcription factor B subunit 3 n=1 Tax=Malassezia vespertilionis TaxID=2020962 RepID=A0A2N1JHJ1_9BASI|nr:Tfb3p [Malassezia vespertilionis]